MYKRLTFAILLLCMVKVTVGGSYEQKKKMTTINDSGKCWRRLDFWTLCIVRYSE
jgi:hypothetical protein